MFYLLTTLILSVSIQASSPALDRLILSSWDVDPLLHAQQDKVKAAELNRFARFLPNNPTISYANSDNRSWKTYGVSLQIGMPGKAFALSSVDREILRAEERELTAKKIELASFVVGRYSACASTRAQEQILKTAVEELQTLKDIFTARYEMGQSTQAERIGIELQHRQARIEYEALKDQSLVACAKLTKYLEERNLDPAIIATIEPAEDLSEDILSSLGSTSMDVLRAEDEIRVSATQRDVAFWRAMPEFTVSYYRNYYNKVVASPIIPVQWTNTWVVGVNIPLLFPFYERSQILQEKADATIRERRAAMRKLEGERTIEDAAKTFRRSFEVLKKLQSHDLPMAETMLDSTLAAYKQGKLGFSELILAKRTWLDLRKEEVNLKSTILTSRLVCLNACERN